MTARTTSTSTSTSSSKGLHVLVTGPTGRTGKYVVEQLLSRNDVAQITLCVRNPDKLIETFPNLQTSPRISTLFVDLSQLSTYPDSLKPFDAIIFTHGSGQWNGPIRLLRIIFGWFWKDHPYYTEYICMRQWIQIAESTNPSIKFVVCSSIGLYNPWWYPSLLLNFMLCGVIKYKYLASQCLQDSNLNYTLILPPGLRDKENPNETIVYNQKWEVLEVPLAMSCPRESVAKVLCDAACNVEKGKKSTLNVWSQKYQGGREDNKGVPLDSYWSEVRSDNTTDRLRFARANHDAPYYVFLGIGLGAVALTIKWTFPKQWNAAGNFAKSLWSK